MHRLLKRQLKRVFGENATLSAEMQALLDQVDAAYDQNDIDRAMVERSMDIMSHELVEQNRRLAAELGERRAAEHRLELSSSILGATLSSTNDGILIVGQNRRVASYNDKFIEMWGVPLELANRGDDHELLDFVAAQLADADSFIKQVNDVAESSAETFDLIEFADGRVFERYSQPHCLGPAIVGRIWSFRDITDHRRAEERLQYLANHDALTALANRNLLLDRLSHAIASAHQRPGDLVAVLHVDVDQLKFINDALGMGFGDKMLCSVAERVSACVRENDTVARIGSDEFVVVLSDLFGEDTINQQWITEILQRVLKVVAQPVVVDGRELNVTCSIGVSLYPQDGLDAEALLRNANAAMFRAKELGRNNGQFYTAEMNARMKERLMLQELLRYAIPRGEFELHYQPKINLADGSLAGVEALLRWNSGELGLVGPDRFIPVLEQTGMINEVGKWVLHRAVSDQRAWKAAGLPAPRVAVNISPIQLKQADFVHVVEQALGGANAGIDLEITESLIMEDVELNIAKLQAVQSMGVGIEIDDFGTGYSSLSYLTKLPVSALKIDRAFIRNLTTNAEDHAVVTAVITLAHSLGLAVVAEGVETVAQSELLKQLGCDEMQGFLISRPLPREKLWKWYAEYTARARTTPVRARG